MDVRTGEVVVNDEKVVKDLQKRAAKGRVPFRFTNAPDDFEKQIEMGYIVPLRNLPKRSCRTCFGRGHVGKDSQTGLYVPCRCVL